MLKLAEILIRAQNRSVIVSPLVRGKTSGIKNAQLKKSIDDIESLRPILSTIAADIMSPGISGELKKRLKHQNNFRKLKHWKCTRSRISYQQS